MMILFLVPWPDAAHQRSCHCVRCRAEDAPSESGSYPVGIGRTLRPTFAMELVSSSFILQLGDTAHVRSI